MTENYHTHTWRCNHAEGREEDYIIEAIKRGFTTLGFSDHVPYRFLHGFDSWYRMRPDQVNDYVNTLLELRDKYKDKIDIKIGFEAEIYPETYEDMLSILRPYPIDYLILGQHFNHNERNAHYSGSPTDDVSLLEDYTNTCIKACENGIFSYIAHPDVFFFSGEDDVYEEYVKKLCSAAKKADIPLEINLLGLASYRHYPYEKFWEIVAGEGNKVILGIDAHSPKEITNAPIEEAKAMVRKLGLNLTESLELKKPF